MLLASGTSLGSAARLISPWQLPQAYFLRRVPAAGTGLLGLGDVLFDDLARQVL
jgi:hypothetical protein